MEEFSFSVYSNRWAIDHVYTIKKTARGWHVSYIAISGNCEPDGNPYLFQNFKQDSISYPSDLGMHLHWLWGQLDSGLLSTSETQSMLKQLGDWVSFCEKSQPQWIGWNC